MLTEYLDTDSTISAICLQMASINTVLNEISSDRNLLKECDFLEKSYGQLVQRLMQYFHDTYACVPLLKDIAEIDAYTLRTRRHEIKPIGFYYPQLAHLWHF